LSAKNKKEENYEIAIFIQFSEPNGPTPKFSSDCILCIQAKKKELS
jgi:hypothetical protein